MVRGRSREEVEVRVLGVDPGTVVTGWGVIDTHGGALRHVASGTIRAGRGDLAGRLALIYQRLCAIAQEHAPDCSSLERNFLARNVQSAFRLGEARGVAMAAAAFSGLPLTEYTPATVKKAVTGHGSAEKAAVQRAMGRLLALSRPLAIDEADALAVAACHVFKSGFEARVVTAIARSRRDSRARAPLRARVMG
jgi:crossover junction endodeoxyribonuclease RuvC